MPDVPTLGERQARAIAKLEAFLCKECGAVRLADQEVRLHLDRRFVTGWRFTAQPLDQPRRLDVYVDPVFPFSAPRFLLVDRPPFLTWPHIEEDGLLCLGDETQPVDASKPAEAAGDLLGNVAFPLLRACEVGSNREDFRSEFYSYWNRTVSSGSIVVRSLVAPRGPTRMVRIWRGRQFSVVGETEDQVLAWLRNLFGDEPRFDETEACCLVWLEKPLIPSEYPERASDIGRIVNSATAFDLVSKWISKKTQPVPLLFAAMSDNGPCFGAATIAGTATTNSLGRRVNPSEKGFRPGQIPARLLTQRLLSLTTPVSRSKVERADASWVHGRDQDPRQPILAKCRVAIIGCGSVGAQVAIQLAMAGVGNLLLIDPEDLTWSNVGRHPLGADSVGRPKVSELAKRLRSSFPHGSFEGVVGSFESVMSEKPELLKNCDLIICATGLWNVESALNAWHSGEAEAPQRVMYCWTEPHAVAGHAVAIQRGEGCLQCHFSPDGDSKLIVTTLKETGQRREPACGAVYQSYGPIELAWINALASGLALDCLLGEVDRSTHRVWAAPKALLAAVGGTWTEGWIKGDEARERGGFQEERPWAKDQSCVICQ